MSAAESKKKNTITITIVGCVIILMAFAVVFFFGFFPGIKAKSSFNKKVDAMSDAKTDVATVFATNAPDGIFEETEVEKVLKSPEKLRSLFLSAADEVNFDETGKELGPSDYKYRIRFITDNGSFDFYVKNGEFYITESGVRHYFAPKNSEAFDKLSDYLDSLFESK